MKDTTRSIERFLGGDPVAGREALDELVALGDAGEEGLFSQAIGFPSTVQIRRRWLQYVASRKATVAERLLDRMRDQSRLRVAYATATLFAGLPRDYSVTDQLFHELDRSFKNVLSDYDSVRNLFSAWGHAGGDAATLWHFIEDSSYAWEKLLTFTFRASCAGFARVNAGDDWAIEQLITHEWRDYELTEIAKSLHPSISHRAVSGSEMWGEANGSFLLWRRGEVADVILRGWSKHSHWRVRDFGAQILASLGFQRVVVPVVEWLNREELDSVRASLLHSLERSETSAGADALLEHFESADGAGTPYVARAAWRATEKSRALRALQAIAAGEGTSAAEALVSMARLGHSHPHLTDALEAHDDYRRLNAAMAVAYLGAKNEMDRLEAMLNEAASPTERVYLAAGLAILGKPGGAEALNKELIAAASTKDYDKRLDIFYLHRYLQIAILDGLSAGGEENGTLVRAWRVETQPLEPMPKPVEIVPTPAEIPAGPSPNAAEVKPSSERQTAHDTVSPAPLNVFISYSHRDEKMRDKLVEHLFPLVNEGLIRIWHDREIDAGADWEADINAEIAGADIILLLVSAPFLKSRYCQKELKTALQKRGSGKASAIPIILRDCDWTSLFNTTEYKIQALPRDDRPVAGGKWPNQDAAFAVIAKELRTKILKLRL